MSNLQLVILLFAQLTAILATCRIVGWLGRRFLGQTQVVMEMVAGVVLGPSLFGLLAPGLQARLFPRQLEIVADAGTVAVTHPSMAVLYALSQLGLVLYMFLIGIELDLGQLRGRARGAGLVSGAGILVPFVLGGALALPLLARDDLFAPAMSTSAAVIFLGASMSITAFPMLARMLYERGLASSRMGTLALAAGAAGDAFAWCLLALVLARFDGQPSLALVTLGGGLLFGLAVLTVGRRVLRHLAQRFVREGELGTGTYTGVLLVLMASALLSDAIGIYAVFGAFFVGAAMPRGALARAVVARTEPLTVSLLLPIFFVFSGLNTRIGLVDSTDLWAVTATIVVIAVVGKGVACTLAARVAGESWHDSLRIGTLMNARGLMELIILNIGLERGLITPTLFAVMVLMAIITTVITSPIFDWIDRRA